MTSEHLQELKAFADDLKRLSQIRGAFSNPANAIYGKIRKDIPEGLHIEDYPTQTQIIASAKRTLFMMYPNGQMFLNPIAIGQIIASLDTIITEEGKPSGWNCIHPKIQNVSKQQYMDGHYATAAVKAFVEIVDRVKKIRQGMHPGENELDGTKLMQHVFGDNGDIILADLKTKVGQDIQEGYRFLFVGSVSGYRNPISHDNSIELSAQEAMRRLMFASALMYKLDEVESQKE